jgi:nucleoside-diphosphate-sugar epimerase
LTDHVLVTGATGFVGRHLCQRLAAGGYRVRVALRNPGPMPAGATDAVVVGDIGSRTDWSEALQEVDHVVHAAGRVHSKDATEASASLCTETNVLGTQSLAVAAARLSVKRFILMSSVKVNGEGTHGTAYTPFDVPNPQGAYARSKWQAEQVVAQTCTASGMEFAIIRPPLVYGPGVRANFLRLMDWVARGYPLPFGAIRNQRSFVSVWNLADLVERSLSNPAAANRTWMVSDGEDLSTAELVRRIAVALERRVHIFPLPEVVLRFGGRMTGTGDTVMKLCGSLRVDLSHTVALLGWNPPTSMDAGLDKTADWYRSAR